MTLREWVDAHPAPPRQARPRGVEVSYSQVRAYVFCPWAYKIRYVDFWRAPLTPPSALGLSIHRALEAFHREDSSTLERLLELYEECWVHAGFPTPQDQLEWHAKGDRILKTYFADELNRRSEIVSVEREFLFPLGPHQARGMIDRIDRRTDGSYEVIDYKTHLDPHPELEDPENLQLRIYGIGARESLAMECSRLTRYYIATGLRVTTPVEPDKEGEVIELLERVADLVALSRTFKPETSACPRCDFRNSCQSSTARAT